MAFTPSQPFYVAFPPAAFEGIINWAGVNILYMKSHACPCVGDVGNPNPKCNVCLARGIYWDPPTGPYVVLITLITQGGRNISFLGDQTDQTFGPISEGDPTLTIPNTTGALFAEASLYDAYIETDATMRFNSVLRVGQEETLPAWHFSNLTIAPTGAVIVEDPTIVQPVSGVTYVVSGSTVTIAGYPEGTSYTVEYQSAPVFISYDKMGSLPHVRPFGQGLLYPRRFKIKLLDLWIRQKFGLSTNLAQNG